MPSSYTTTNAYPDISHRSSYSLSIKLSSRSSNSSIPPAKEYLWHQFTINDGATMKHARATCKHCKHELIKQAKPAESHLNHCGSYQSYLNALGKATTTVLDEFHHRYSPADQEAHSRRLGLALFTAGLPFHVFDRSRSFEMWDFIHQLNIAYRIPERHTIANSLLPQCYTDV